MDWDWLLSFASAIVVQQSAASKAPETEKVANYGFQMPLHYPRYARSDYEKMNEEQIDLLLRQYGLNFRGDLDEKRKFAMGAFLWPDQF
ncbi:uncharacterized protein LOC131003192 [Salvia miltiorrhiza]|uniref:uncharacterized protein LOC131003192 n=1 Tax=Salvia miltiorrhiza TaxID=226208 RepID=UPI0025ACB66E|nr:uncharacterized protein LOC131003192 [Salvia miltiorrhiza]